MLNELARANLSRDKLITASEVAAIVGVSPWQTSHDIWLRKKGHVSEETSAMRRGTAAEDIIHEYVCLAGTDGTPPMQVEQGLRYGDAPIQGPVEWAAASPDGAAQDWDGKWYLLEYKTSAQPWFGGIPPHYLVQVRWQLLCCPAAQYAVLVAITEIPAAIDAMLGSSDKATQDAGKLVLRQMLAVAAITPHVYIVERNEQEERALLHQVREWYDRHVVLDIEPELTARDLAAVQRTWMALEASQEVEVDDDTDQGTFARLTGKLTAADATAKEAEDAAKKARAELLSYWAEKYPQAEVVRLPSGQKISYKSQAGRSSIDTDRLRAEHPQIAAAYTKQGASFRTLRIGK